MPRLTCKRLAEILGVRPTKATQAWEPAITKVADAMLKDPHGTILALLEKMEQRMAEEPPDGWADQLKSRRPTIESRP
jgi:hypothetical protein